MSEVEATVAGVRRHRPPLAELLLDMRLVNKTEQSRWFAIPETLGPGLSLRDSRIVGVDPVVLEGTGRVVVAAFRGATGGGFRALLLPPGADVRLRGVPLAFSGDTPATPLTLDYLTAEALLVDGVPADEWMAAEPHCDVLVDASYDQAQRIRARYTDNYIPVAVTAVAERHGEIIAG